MTNNPTSAGEGLNYIDWKVIEAEDSMRRLIEAGEVEVDGLEDAVSLIAMCGLLERRALERKQSILVSDHRALMAGYRQGQ